MPCRSVRTTNKERDRMNISITKTAYPKEKPDASTLGFGKIFTDHMFMMDYSREEGWHDARIVPF